MYLGNQPNPQRRFPRNTRTEKGILMLLFMHRTMATSQFYILLVFGLHVISSNTKPVNEWGNGKNNFDAEIEEISKKEYDTVHGRILAVNMAHMRKKRQAAGNESDDGNTFKAIKEANKDIRKGRNVSQFYQGDIKLDSELEDYVKTGGNSRNAIREKKRVWSSRIIPYRIPSWMSHISSNVQKAIQELHTKTCLRFVNYNRAYHRNYIEFGNSDGCSSRVGKRYAEPGRQTISIGDGCNWAGTILHELMHAIGFFHEQARIDRDKYVKIYWENIVSGYSDQFDKYSWRTLDHLGVSYDYQSIMHYDRKAFTKNGKPTIVAIGNENMEFGSPNGLLSTRDALEVNALYDCKTKTYGWTSWSGWTPCDDNCYRTRERFCYNSGNLKACGGNVNAYGIETRKEKCSSSICPAPIDGHWGRWSDWSSCSKTCNDGTRTRFRRCDNPRPGHRGKSCPGISREKVTCILKRCNLDSDDVDFDNGRFGMWVNSRSDNLDWQLNRFYTQTVDTGPSRDHTSGKGFYLYVESSSRRKGEKADLVSPWVQVRSGGQCLKFYYTMYGKTMGTLAVRVELSDGRNWYIFYKAGNQGMEWMKGIGNIDLPLGLRYRLKIEGKIGDTGYSDIAIDDVYIDPGLCSCQDDFHTCQFWAAKKECTANPTWMKQHCKRSCKVCGGPITTQPPAPPAPPTPKPTTQLQSCQDSSGYRIQCPKWAKNGECKKNPGWMLINCKKSCTKDSHQSCPAWAKLGECTKNPRYMLVYCKLSCNQC